MNWTPEKWAEKVLSEAVDGIRNPEGPRHDAVVSMAAKMADYVADGSIGAEKVTAALTAAAHDVGLGGKRAQETARGIAHGLSKGTAGDAWYPSSAGGRPSRSSLVWGDGRRYTVDAPAVVSVAPAMPPVGASSAPGVRLTFYSGRRARRGHGESMPWGDLVDSIECAAPPPRGGKDALELWAAHELKDDDNHKGRTPVAMHALFLDYDDDPSFSEEAVAYWWAGYQWVAHTSMSHMIEKKGVTCARGRVIVPLSRPATPEEWPQIAAWAMDGSRGKVGAETAEFCRMYYRPARVDGYAWWCRDGGAVDVDAICGGDEPPEEEPPPPRTPIQITTDIAATALQSLDALERHPEIYVYGGQAVRVAGGKITPVRVETVRVMLSQVAAYHRMAQVKGEWVEKPCPPPKDTATALLEMSEWCGLRPLQGVVDVPIVGRGGGVGTAGGYHAASGMYLHRPSSVGLCGAAEGLDVLRGIVCDYEMSEAAFSAWVSLVLTPLARHLYHGPTPLFVVSANVRGAGKTLLAETAGVIAAGRQYRMVPYPKNDEELDKTLRGIVQEGAAFCCLDNASYEIGSATLDAMTTSASFSARILGTSKVLTLDRVPTTLVATANSASYRADTARRAMPIEIEVQCARPEDREGFVHEDLRRAAAEQRPALLGAALSILDAWEVAGRRGAVLRKWGSFSAWSEVVRGAIVAAGGVDPIEARRGVDRQDTEGDAFEALIELCATFQRQVGTWWTVGEFARAVDASTITAWEDYECRHVIALIGGMEGGAPNSRRIGRRLRRWEARVALTGARLRRSETKRRGNWRWTVDG
jgi:hypothetical protein